ncbi:MAG: hypothetical protein RLZZ399_324, partial [Verrucomicrobiota bacterium]
MSWMHFTDVHRIPSPSLVLYWDRIEANLQRMIATVGDVGRLCPHLKTHKLAEITRLQLEAGIRQCKTATIAEAEMAAVVGVPQILLAQQPVGPNLPRFVELIRRFPHLRFATLCDHEPTARLLGTVAASHALEIEVLVDLNVGQNRTGILPGEEAAALYSVISRIPGLRCAGLHAYDGHLHQSDPVERARACEAAFEPVWALRESLQSAGLSVPRTVVGGTPTFPFHARRADVECSPGTLILWDAGYGARFQDMDYLPAAVLLARVVSRPGPRLLCLDLGHKAVGSEMPHPRVVFPDLPDVTVLAHNEEHLVIQTAHANDYAPGDHLFGIPWHVCPTVALHSEVVVVKHGALQGVLPVTARG